MIRVLHVVGAMNRAGAEAMLMSLYRKLDKTQIQFDFLEFADGQSDFHTEIEALGGRVLKCQWAQRLTSVPRNRRSIATVINENGPYAAVHSHILFASGIVLSAATDSGVPIRIAHSHNTSDTGHGLVNRCYRGISRWLIRRNSTAVVACSNEAGRYLFRTHKFDTDGIILRNSVDLEQFFPSSKHDRQLSQTSEKVDLVAVARLEPVKNHEFLVDLASELRTRGINFKMKFVGTGSLRNQLETAITEKDLGYHIELVGLRKDVDEILRNCDALLMPSLWEGLPVTLVEAQATGTPCLVSDAITSDADLGLGLLTYLSLDNVATWADSIEAGFPIRPTPDEIQESFETHGYTIDASIKKLHSLYGLTKE